MVLGVQVADGPALAAEDHRFGLRPEVVIDDAVQELSIGDARGGEGHVLTAHQVIDREDAAQVLVAGGARFLLVVAGSQPEAALGRPFATRVEPSSGLSATSQASPLPSPTIWPRPSGTESDSSPITIVPLTCTPVSASRMALAAVPRIPSRSRFPIQRPAERAAASVARTSSRPRFGWTVRGVVALPEEGVETSDFTRFATSCPLRSPASSAPPHRRPARRP